MTFKQYIDNPLGKNNAVFSQRQLYAELYTKKYDAVLLREAGKVDYTLLYDEKKDEYYCHIKIPSEVVPKFYYDVVIMFYSDDNANATATSLTNYKIKVFSNDPAFVYTYLRVFLKNNMFIEDLSSRAPKLALKKDPKERNPYELVGYVKSLYFAYLFMMQKNLFSKHFYKNNGIKYSKKTLVSNVEDADTKIEQRQEAGQRVAKQKRRDKLNDASAVVSTTAPSDNIQLSRSTKRILTTPKIGGLKKTGNIKNSSKKTRTTKKI